MRAEGHAATYLSTGPERFDLRPVSCIVEGMSTDVQEPVPTDEDVTAALKVNVPARMASLGISQNGLAKMTGDPVSTINNIINGNHLPRGGVLVRIAEALQTTTDALLTLTQKKSRRAS